MSRFNLPFQDCMRSNSLHCQTFEHQDICLEENLMKTSQENRNEFWILPTSVDFGHLHSHVSSSHFWLPGQPSFGHPGRHSHWQSSSFHHFLPHPAAGLAISTGQTHSHFSSLHIWLPLHPPETIIEDLMFERIIEIDREVLPAGFGGHPHEHVRSFQLVLPGQPPKLEFNWIIPNYNNDWVNLPFGMGVGHPHEQVNSLNCCNQICSCRKWASNPSERWKVLPENLHKLYEKYLKFELIMAVE